MPAAPKCLVHALSNFSRLTHLPRNERTTSLCSSPLAKCGGNLYFLSIRGIYIQSGIGGRRAGDRIFYKFTSKVLWSHRHLTSWKRLPLGSQIPRSLVPLRVSKQRKRACGEFIKNPAAVRCPLIPNLNMNFPKLLLCYLIWCSAH